MPFEAPKTPAITWTSPSGPEEDHEKYSSELLDKRYEGEVYLPRTRA
jgi:hypothetical protein